MDEEHSLTKAERKALKKQQKLEREAKAARRSKIKHFSLYGLIGLVAVGIGLYIWQGVVRIPDSEKDKPIDTILVSDWSKGNAKAPVVIVEYSDFQCPACQKFAPIMDELITSYPDQIVLTYRHFPLKQVHLQVELAAYAAEAAGKQGNFSGNA